MNAKELGGACAFPANDMQLMHRIGMAASMTLPQGERDEAYIKASVAAAAGLTKRELFAAMAMQGILANEVVSRAAYARASEPGGDRMTMGHAICEAAVGYADSLLAELAKDQP